MGLKLLEAHKILTLQSKVEMRRTEQDLETQSYNRINNRITNVNSHIVANNNTLIAWMSLSVLKITERRVQDLLGVEAAKLLVHRPLGIVGIAPSDWLAVIVENVIRNIMRGPRRFKRIAGIEVRKHRQRSPIAQTATNSRAALR